MFLRKMILQSPEGEVSGGGSGAAPAPSSPTPTPVPSSPAPVSSSAAPAASSSGDRPGTVEEFDFGALADYASGKEDVAAQGEVAPTPVAPAPSPAPSAPAPVPVAPPPSPAPAPSPTPPEPQASQPAATGNQPASGQEPPAPQPVDWQKHREQFLPKLQQMYQFTEAEIQEFREHPEVALPKMAAELHYKVSMAAHNAMIEILPAMIGRQMEMQKAATKHNDVFYSRWPKLKEAVDRDINVEKSINESIRAYRSANPKATLQDVIEKAGLLAMLSLNIAPDIPGAQAPSPVAPTPSPAPMIPGRPAGTGAQAHVPMVPRGSAPGEVSEADFFADLANHFANGGG